jgi:hypothetical protein
MNVIKKYCPEARILIITKEGTTAVLPQRQECWLEECGCWSAQNGMCGLIHD